MWSYEESLEWLYARQGKGIKLGLDGMQSMLDELGNPETIPAIHVGGTNGKGSVSTLMAAALQKSGKKTGLFTSPHLIRFTERITVDGEEISRGDVAELLWALKPLAQKRDLEDAGPTFFELVTLLAFLYFRRESCDVIVLEVGLGGRLDCTNVCLPILSIITNVSKDHQEFLGEHIGEIALEKAGIMRPGIPCITGASGEALHYLKIQSHETGTPMGILGEDTHLVPDINGFQLASPTGSAHYELGMAGEHQLENAALTVMACEALGIRPMAIHEALRDTQHPGRLETFHYEGLEVLVDGAHNEAAAHALRRHLAHLGWEQFHLIAGFNADKDWQELLAQWFPLAQKTWGVPLRSGRSLDPESMRDTVEGMGLLFESSTLVESMQGAKDAGMDRILIAGSLFLAGEARAMMLGESLEEIKGNQ